MHRWPGRVSGGACGTDDRRDGLSRYSTRKMVEIESAMADRASRMAHARSHGVDRHHVDRAIEKQDRAIEASVLRATSSGTSSDRAGKIADGKRDGSKIGRQGRRRGYRTSIGQPSNTIHWGGADCCRRWLHRRWQIEHAGCGTRGMEGASVPGSGRCFVRKGGRGLGGVARNRVLHALVA